MTSWSAALNTDLTFHPRNPLSFRSLQSNNNWKTLKCSAKRIWTDLNFHSIIFNYIQWKWGSLFPCHTERFLCNWLTGPSLPLIGWNESFDVLTPLKRNWISLFEYIFYKSLLRCFSGVNWPLEPRPGIEPRTTGLQPRPAPWHFNRRLVLNGPESRETDLRGLVLDCFSRQQMAEVAEPRSWCPAGPIKVKTLFWPTDDLPLL